MNNNNIKLPPPWQLVNDGMGRQLYYNPMTNQQSYTPPPGSTPQQQPTQQQPQQMQFPISNLGTPNSSISKSLPDGWEESTDNQGRVYYIDHVNKKTSWIHPSFTHQLHQQPTSPATPTNNNNNNTTSSKVTPAQSVPIVSKPITSPSPSSSYQDNAFYPSFSEYGYAPNSNNNISSSSSTTTTTTAHIPTQSKPIPSTSNNNNSNNSSYSDDSSYKSRNVASSPPSVKTPVSTSSTSPQGSGSKTNVLLSHISPLWDLEKIVPACSNCYSPFTVIKRRVSLFIFLIF